MKGLQYSANAQACVIMSLSIYLYHKRIHKNPMLRVTCWNRSWLLFKKVGERKKKRSKLINDLHSPKTETTLWYCENSCWDNKEEMWGVPHPNARYPDTTENEIVAWGLSSSVWEICRFHFSFFAVFWAGVCVWGRDVVFLPHTGTKLFMFFSWLNTAIQKNNMEICDTSHFADPREWLLFSLRSVHKLTQVISLL